MLRRRRNMRAARGREGASAKNVRESTFFCANRHFSNTNNMATSGRTTKMVEPDLNESFQGLIIRSGTYFTFTIL